MKQISRMLIVVGILGVVVLATFAVPTRAERAERVLVRFKPGQKESVKQALGSGGGQIHYAFDRLNTIAVTLPTNAVDGLRRNPNVVLVEQDQLRYPTEQAVPYGIDSVEARDVWDADRDGEVDPDAPTGSGLTVCVIDSGLYTDHEDFAGVDIIGGYPRKTWDTDNCGHGTHVAGTIAAMNNSIGVVGVSPGSVSLYIVKVFNDDCDWAYVSTLVDAAYQCYSAGAKIINMSLTGQYYSSFENSAFQDLYDEGVLSVASAGNGGGTAYGYPASYDAVISVGAVDQSNVVAGFSRKNDKVELAAPGASVYSTYKDGGYVLMSGTSMAAPHVSAAAAVVWSSKPSKTNDEIRVALRSSALDLGAAGRDNSYGYGLLQSNCACQALSPEPTSVELARFAAVPDSTSVHVEWETVSEVDSTGFNLYRAESQDGPRSQLNARLIPSKSPPGSPEGAVYRFVDDLVRPGVTFYYWLEDVDVYGASTYHGPVTTVISRGRRFPLPSRPRPEPGPSLPGR
jgi:subtilisin family serine protease